MAALNRLSVFLSVLRGGSDWLSNVNPIYFPRFLVMYESFHPFLKLILPYYLILHICIHILILFAHIIIFKTMMPLLLS